jgi:hypothetical protein
MGNISDAYHDAMKMWGIETRPPVSRTTSPDTYGTGDGGVQLPSRRLRPNEFRRLLEAYYDRYGELPRDQYEFERWLDG